METVTAIVHRTEIARQNYQPPLQEGEARDERQNKCFNEDFIRRWCEGGGTGGAPVIQDITVTRPRTT